MRPVSPSRNSQNFAAPGRYASRADHHGPAGHHTGVDLGSAWPIPIDGRTVRSVTPGVVVISEYDKDVFGNWVGVYYARENMTVTYWHLRTRLVHVGDRVLPFQPIGRVGNTGNSTAPHLHVQVNRGEGFDYHHHINPWKAFRLFPWWTARRIYRDGIRRHKD